LLSFLNEHNNADAPLGNLLFNKVAIIARFLGKETVLKFLEFEPIQTNGPVCNNFTYFKFISQFPEIAEAVKIDVTFILAINAILGESNEQKYKVARLLISNPSAFILELRNSKGQFLQNFLQETIIIDEKIAKLFNIKHTSVSLVNFLSQNLIISPERHKEIILNAKTLAKDILCRLCDGHRNEGDRFYGHYLLLNKKAHQLGLYIQKMNQDDFSSSIEIDEESKGVFQFLNITKTNISGLAQHFGDLQIVNMLNTQFMKSLTSRSQTFEK
jgi:hypothetical protein